MGLNACMKEDLAEEKESASKSDNMGFDSFSCSSSTLSKRRPGAQFPRVQWMGLYLPVYLTGSCDDMSYLLYVMKGIINASPVQMQFDLIIK